MERQMSKDEALWFAYGAIKALAAKHTTLEVVVETLESVLFPKEAPDAKAE